MAVTIKQIEGAPDEYPDLVSPSPLSAAAAALDPAIIWQRIEAYVAHRWGERSVEWVVEGPGEWVPPLKPALIENVEVWSAANEWEAVTLNPSPLGGYQLPASGPYRFTGTAGDENEPPANVFEAFRRLAEYLAARPGKPGARVERISAGSVGLSTHRHEAWAARAMQNSGAGDLLRPYRRAA